MAGAIYGVDGVIVLFFLACLGLGLWALIDAIVRPNLAFKASRQSKALWIILPIVGLWLALVPGAIIGVIYLTAIRPKVRAAT